MILVGYTPWTNKNFKNCLLSPHYNLKAGKLWDYVLWDLERGYSIACGDRAEMSITAAEFAVRIVITN